MTAATKTLLAAAAVLLLTVFHHAYGAVIYAMPWRHHIAIIVLPLLLVLLLVYGVHRWRPQTKLGRICLWLFMILIWAVPVAWIGIYEGGYNHLVNNMLFFAGTPQATLVRFFPRSLTKCPTISGSSSPASCNSLLLYIWPTMS